MKTKDLKLKGIRGRSQTISGLETSTPISSTREGTLDSTDVNRFSNQKNMQTTLIFPEEDSDLNIDMVHAEIYQRTVYLDGPLLVLPPNLYLYSEPKLEDILSFDLVINVAKEIPNLEFLIPPEMAHKIKYYHIEWTHIQDRQGLIPIDTHYAYRSFARQENTRTLSVWSIKIGVIDCGVYHAILWLEFK